MHVQTQTEWEEEMSLKILNFVRNEIYLDLRFLDVALSALLPKAEEGLSSVATDGTYLYFSSEQVLRVFKQNSAFLDRAFLHSVLHCIFCHLWIGGNRDRYIWQIACDIAVEYTIDKMNKPCTKRALSWIRQKTYQELEREEKGISAAVIYRRILHYKQKELKELQREFYTDDHRHWPKQEDKNTAAQAAQNKWSRIARQSKMQQQRRGDDPKEGEELLASQMRAERGKRNYRDFLQKFSVLREELQSDPDEFDLNYYSYGLRLYRDMPLIEPLESREVKKIQEFVVVVDTSYSTSGELVENFLKETFGILTQEDSFFRKSRIRIIQCDNQVRMDQVVSSTEELKYLLEHFEIAGGGGTDFRPAFAYVNELLKTKALQNLSGLLYFTDGKGIYPKKRPPYKTAFLFLEDYEEDTVPPWAIRLRLEPEEFLPPVNTNGDSL